ncbi:MAG: c-type cytochrome [Acidimicrobiales bacterium]
MKDESLPPGTATDPDATEPRAKGGWVLFATSSVASFMGVFTVGLLILTFGLTSWNDEPAGGGEPGAVAALEGERIYQSRCASCHGRDGEGIVGPRLAGTVVEKYPDIADQIAVVTNGRGGMAAFGDQLTAAEIEAVVIFERTELGQGLEPEPDEG